MAYRVGVDIGGTFTDFALLDEGSGALAIHKQLTTPDDPARAVVEGVPALLRKAGVAIDAVGTLVHGTTLVTNALIERKGAATGMLVTRGFADVLDIAMERRYDMYDLRIAYPQPLIPRALRVEIDERIGPDGAVRQALDMAAVGRAADTLARQGCGAIAICFLNAHTNAAHEEAAAAIVRAAHPVLAVSTSADVFPFMREYERWTTTTMNAFTQPMFARYLARLADGLKELGFAGALYVMSSSGGTVAVDTARRYPVRMLESGPAAGVLVSAAIGRLMERPDLLAFDMGGTTAKGALIRAGVPLKRYDMEVARVHEFKAGSGLPAKIPVIDLIEIGAGGGSIAHLDARGVIAAGPHSAGAAPGPVCYGRGGTNPTLTDANLVLGYLDPSFFLGGEMALDRGGASAALARVVGAPLGVDAANAAWGVHETVNENVARAFRNHAAERGFDYRACAMVAFGGSGPLHALRVARKLRVPRVIFPLGAGVMSAVGLLVSPLAFEVLRSERIAHENLTVDSFDARFAKLADQAAAQLASAGVTRANLVLRRALDMRYRGQGYEIEVALPDGDGAALVARLPELFAQAYATVFAKSFPAEPVEIVAWKLEVVGPTPGRGAEYRLAGVGGGAAIKGKRQAWFAEARGFAECPVYDRYALKPADSFVGPAIVEERESTAIVGIGDRAEIDARGNLLVEVGMT
jgi:N-methylhydantoinase A